MIASGYKEWDNDTDWQALVWIWEHESGWRWNATERRRVRHPAIVSRVEARDDGKRLEEQRGHADQIGGCGIKSRYGSPGKAKESWLV